MRRAEVPEGKPSGVHVYWSPVSSAAICDTLAHGGPILLVEQGMEGARLSIVRNTLSPETTFSVTGPTAFAQVIVKPSPSWKLNIIFAKRGAAWATWMAVHSSTATRATRAYAILTSRWVRIPRVEGIEQWQNPLVFESPP